MHTKSMPLEKISVGLWTVIGILSFLPPLLYTHKALSAPVNLIKNPSVETGTTTPDFWKHGSFGSNTAVFTYPTTGIDGARSVRVDVSEITSGDAKWFFSDVPIKPGAKYVFSDSYASNVATEVVIQYQTTGGAANYVFLGTLPPSAETATKQFIFTAPHDAVSLTIFHLIDKVGYLTTDKYSLVEDTGSDITPPEIRLILPSAGTAVATATPLSFGATDDFGVAGVALFVDGNTVGPEDTLPPYDFLWDTNAVPNGPHMISGRARDAAGNTAMSAEVELTVNNSTAPKNIIENPLLETPGENGNPAHWMHGSWGTNTTTFTYPVPGTLGGKAAKIEMADYSSGDAKWYFKRVPVSAGKTYSFTDSYKANIPTTLTAELQTDSGILSYQYIASVPASSDWKTETYNITVPSGASAMTIFHSIGANGTLQVDNYTLIPGMDSPPVSDMFARGLVSLSFDDGWVTQYFDALPVLNAAGLKGTFYIISQETINAVPTERISNPLLETPGENGNPAHWMHGSWGTNTTTFTYPVPGALGGKAAKIEMADYSSGDAKWYFEDTEVFPDEDYVFSENYQSDAPSIITVRYTFFDGSVQYADIASAPSSNGTWEKFSKTITIPTNVHSITVFHLLKGNGSLTVDHYSLKMVPIYMNTAQMLELQSAGHEIGGHTQHHVSLSSVPPATAQNEIVGSRNDLLGAGVTKLDGMAYPYGDYNDTIKTMAKNAGFATARGVGRGFNTKSTDKYELKIQQMDRTTTMSDVQAWVAQAATTNQWLILMFHQEDGNPAHDLGVTPAFFRQIVDYIKTTDVDVVTVAEGVAQMNP